MLNQALEMTPEGVGVPSSQIVDFLSQVVPAAPPLQHSPCAGPGRRRPPLPAFGTVPPNQSARQSCGNIRKRTRRGFCGMLDRFQGRRSSSGLARSNRTYLRVPDAEAHAVASARGLPAGRLSVQQWPACGRDVFPQSRTFSITTPSRGARHRSRWAKRHSPPAQPLGLAVCASQ